jgi:hypothetical protein
MLQLIYALKKQQLTVSNAFTAQDFIEEQLSSPRSTLLKNNMLIIKKFRSLLYKIYKN